MFLICLYIMCLILILAFVIYLLTKKIIPINPPLLSELIGKQAKVTEAIGPHAFQVGTIKVAGDTLPAISTTASFISKESIVIIDSFEGVYACVHVAPK